MEDRRLDKRARGRAIKTVIARMRSGACPEPCRRVAIPYNVDPLNLHKEEFIPDQKKGDATHRPYNR